jgi:nicotinamidase-related amidase
VGRHAAVLVLVDVQERLANAMAGREEVVAACVLLARVAHELGVPTIVTRQYPQGLGDVVAEFADIAERAVIVDKTAFDCMKEPAFVDSLARTGRRQVVLAGMEAHICITQTALALIADGYDVHVVADAVCSRRDADRDVALDRLRAAGVTVTCTESAIYEALGEAGTPEFRSVLALVKEQPLAE